MAATSINRMSGSGRGMSSSPPSTSPKAPPSATCASPSPPSDIEYDDHIIVAFNDLILLAAVDLDAQSPFGEVAGFFAYEWLRLRDQPLDFGTYCVDNCELPDTETSGTIALELNEDLVHRLGFAAQQQDRAELSVITTGDDNDDRDCHHSGFDIDVTLTVTP